MKTLFLIILFSYSSAFANINEYLDAYEKNNHLITASQENLKSTQNQVKEVRGSLFPDVKANIGKTKIDNIIGFTGSASLYQASLEIVQPIYTGGKLFTALDLAKVELATSSLSLKKTREEVRLEAWKSLIDYINSLEKHRIAAEQKELQKRNLDIIKRKKGLGNAKSYELDQAEADFLSRKIQYDQIQLGLNQAEKGLKEKTGLNSIPTKISTFPQELIPSYEELTKENYEIKNLQFRLKALKYTNRIDLGDDLPSLNVSLSQGYRATSTADLFDSNNETSTLSINASIPLFSGLSSLYKRRSHSASIKSLELQLRETKRSLKISYENLVQEVKLRQKLLKDSQKWLNHADKSLKLAITTYRNGQINFLQLLQIQQSLDNASSQYWDNWAAFHKSQLELKYLAGTSLK